MAVRMVKCKYCGIQFDRNAEPAVEVSARRYAHKACAEQHQAAIPQDEQDYAALETYIKRLFKEDNINVKVKEINLDSVEFKTNVEQFDLLIKQTNDSSQILTIEEVVIANYQEIIKKQ